MLLNSSPTRTHTHHTELIEAIGVNDVEMDEVLNHSKFNIKAVLFPNLSLSFCHGEF